MIDLVILLAILLFVYMVLSISNKDTNVNTKELMLAANRIEVKPGKD
jgi:hypothetical protein